MMKEADYIVDEHYEEGKTIDRIDNDLGYSPENCKFSTHLEQNNNRRPRKLYSRHKSLKNKGI